MAKKKKVKYERVDEESDNHRRILVKFNPSIWTGSDFEIEFVPLEDAIRLGKNFVRNVDSMSSIDLYQWSAMQECLMWGTSKTEGGTIISKDDSEITAEYLTSKWRERDIKLEPREVIGRVKQLYEVVVERKYSEETAFALNYFFCSGELGSLPYGNPYFTIEKLKTMIEEVSYPSKNADGDVVERPLVRHLFDVHKTEYVTGTIQNFLERMWRLRNEILEKHKKKEQ